jgi:hypothetical protein
VGKRVTTSLKFDFLLNSLRQPHIIATAILSLYDKA